MKNYVHIGNTQKTYGVNGELKLRLEDKYLDDIENLEVVFLKIEGKVVPYFVESVKIGGNVLIKFEDINSPEEAKAIVSKELYAKKEDLIPDEQRELEIENMEFKKFIGYTIIDEEKGRVGVIKEVVEYPQQEMAVVDLEDREILIPLNKNFIKKSDIIEKIVFMQLPDGLLAL